MKSISYILQEQRKVFQFVIGYEMYYKYYVTMFLKKVLQIEISGISCNRKTLNVIRYVALWYK